MANTTNKQDKDFAEKMQDNSEVEISYKFSALDEAIDWMQSNLNPEDVFSEEKLEKWAEENGYAIKEE